MVRQIAHIIIPPREKRSATFRVFTAETTPEEEAERGLLFGLFAIDYYHHRNEEIIDSIIEELQSRYYDPDITVREPEDLFEETLRSLNTTLAQLIENEQIFLNVKRFHAVIGVLRGRSLTFANVGDFSVFLMHQGVAEKKHLIDLLANTETKEEKKSPPITRIFSNLVTGTLRTNDAVLCATSNLFDYYTKERLQKTIASLAPTRALEQIKTLMSDVKNAHGLLCFLLRLAPEHETAAPHDSEHSIATLHATEKDTRNYLAPSVLRNAWRNTTAIALRIENAARFLLRIPPTAPRSAIITEVMRWALILLRSIGRCIIFSYRFAGSVITFGKKIVQHHGDWRSALTAVREHSQKGVGPLVHKGKKQFDALSLRQRVLVITAALLAGIVLVSIITISIQRSRKIARANYEKNITLIRERINTAEASLLFKDEDRTQTIYGEALALIETLPQKTKAERETREQLAKEVQSHLEKLRHIIPLARIDVIKDFRELDSAVSVQSLAIIDNNAYVAHESRPIIYKTNLDNKQTLTLDASGVDVRPVKHFAPEEKNPLVYVSFDTAGIAALKLDKQSVAQTDITFGEAGVAVNDMTLYNKRLYILDTARNQIWRHDKKDGGFAKGSAWLKTTIDLAGARALAIDGPVWIAKKTEVMRLLQGKPTNWKLETFDPPALALRSIIANEKSKKLWLLDEAGKRVLAIEKDSGKLLAQYPLPADDIRDFSVNEKTGDILLLTKTKLLLLSYEKE